MSFREGALVAFTLLMQVSVGILLVLAALPLVQTSQVKADGSAWSLGNRLDLTVVVALVAAVAGLLASLLHLGHPAEAWLAVANVRGSWLSREIGLAVVFVLALAGFALTHVGYRGSPALATLTTAAGIIAGLALVVVMARLYMIAGQPAWDRMTTPLSFLVSTALLGLVVVVTLASPPLGLRTTRVLGVAAVTLLTFQVLLVPALLAGVPAEPTAALSSLSVGNGALWLAAGRIAAGVAGAVLLVALMRNGAALHVATRTRYVALALVLVSETLGRALFYASAVRL